MGERWALLAFLTILAGPLTTCASAAGETGVLAIGKQKQLFVDNYIIDQMNDVCQVLNPASKYAGNPVLRQPWEGIQFDVGSVIYDDEEDLFKIWGYMPAHRCYMTSEDGIDWQRPELGIVDFQGSKVNGIIHSPQDPDASKRYKSRPGRRGAFSADGLRWEVPAESQDIPGDIASDNVIPYCYDEQSGRYLAFPKVVRQSGQHLRRSVSVSFSDDFLTWTPVQTILVPDERDDELARQRVAALRDHVGFDDGPEWHIAQFYGHAGFPYEGMYLGLLWVFDISGWPPGLERRPSTGGEDGPVQVELTCSRDLLNWERVGERQVLIPVGEPGTWEAGQIYTTNRPLIVGDEIWIYYVGEQPSHGHPVYFAETEEAARSYADVGGGIGLAKLRLDGWVSVDAGDESGTLTTKLLTFDGDELVINADAQGGWIGVEILGEAGAAMPGFALADCRRFSGDSVRHTVRWQSDSDLSALRGEPVRLRFQMQNTKLYSFALR